MKLEITTLAQYPKARNQHFVPTDIGIAECRETRNLKLET
jgi:hypothetical protein